MQSSSVMADADRHTPWQPSEERDQADPELAATLREVVLSFLRAANQLIQANGCTERA